MTTGRLAPLRSSPKGMTPRRPGSRASRRQLMAGSTAATRSPLEGGPRIRASSPRRSDGPTGVREPGREEGPTDERLSRSGDARGGHSLTGKTAITGAGLRQDQSLRRPTSPGVAPARASAARAVQEAVADPACPAARQTIDASERGGFVSLELVELCRRPPRAQRRSA
jgi:hypothetical protein